MYTLVINGRVVSEAMMVANTFVSRLRGLMFKKDICFECLMIKPCRSIHTFNMKFRIDVMWVDINGKVLGLDYDVSANRVLKGVPGSCQVIEGKSGLFNDINIGDVIDYSRTI